jgi:hypothetical protein
VAKLFGCGVGFVTRGIVLDDGGVVGSGFADDAGEADSDAVTAVLGDDALGQTNGSRRRRVARRSGTGSPTRAQTSRSKRRFRDFDLNDATDRLTVVS